MFLFVQSTYSRELYYQEKQIFSIRYIISSTNGQDASYKTFTGYDYSLLYIGIKINIGNTSTAGGNNTIIEKYFYKENEILSVEGEVTPKGINGWLGIYDQDGNFITSYFRGIERKQNETKFYCEMTVGTDDGMYADHNNGYYPVPDYIIEGDSYDNCNIYECQDGKKGNLIDSRGVFEPYSAPNTCYYEVYGDRNSTNCTAEPLRWKTSRSVYSYMENGYPDYDNVRHQIQKCVYHNDQTGVFIPNYRTNPYRITSSSSSGAQGNYNDQWLNPNKTYRDVYTNGIYLVFDTPVNHYNSEVYYQDQLIYSTVKSQQKYMAFLLGNWCFVDDHVFRDGIELTENDICPNDLKLLQNAIGYMGYKNVVFQYVNENGINEVGTFNLSRGLKRHNLPFLP
jgi:hypothetical protein